MGGFKGHVEIWPANLVLSKTEVIAMNEQQELILDNDLRLALGAPAEPDFATWQQSHAEAIVYLNPVVTATYQRRRRMLVRIASGLAAAAIFVAVTGWFLVPQGPTLAQTVNTINKAETITWTITFYTRYWSKDGKRSWLKKEPRWERSYLAPGRMRDVKFDDDGRVAFVDIEDVAAGKVLHLDMKKKTAMLKNEPSGQFGPGGNPFAGVAKVLAGNSIEFVGPREVEEVEVNVFRHRAEFRQGGLEINDFWLDAKTKQLVGYVSTSEDKPFDPATDHDRDNQPEKKFSKGTIAGMIQSDIVFDAQLDPKLFSLTPPEGFTIVESKPRPNVTEEMLIEWLRVSAHANGDTFVDADIKAAAQWRSALYKKPKADRSEAEKQFLNLEMKHSLNRNFYVMGRFADDATEPRSFQYIGKGAKLGDASRIICWYRLKGSEKYQAVYGDLTVKEVKPDELPLPVAK